MTTPTPLLKLFALGLVAWVLFGSHAAGHPDAVMVVALLALVALVDAGQASKEDKRENGEDRTKPRVSDADIGAVVRRLLGVEVGPFYVALMVLAGVGMMGKDGEAWQQGDHEMRGQGPVLAKPSMCGGSCGSGAGCGSGGCGAGNGGACGCSGGSSSKKTSSSKPKTSASQPPNSSSGMPGRSTLPTSALPGIGPDAKPLPPSLTPDSSIPIPSAAQKLLDQRLAQEAAAAPVVPVASTAPAPVTPAATVSSPPQPMTAPTQPTPAPVAAPSPAPGSLPSTPSTMPQAPSQSNLTPPPSSAASIQTPSSVPQAPRPAPPAMIRPPVTETNRAPLAPKPGA